MSSDNSLDEASIFKQYGRKKLDEEELVEHLRDLNNGWQLKRKPDRIEKEFTFRNFKQALKFTNKVGEIAEKINHHPDIYIHSYKKARIELRTHSLNGLHQVDFILARKIEALRGPTS